MTEPAGEPKSSSRSAPSRPWPRPTDLLGPAIVALAGLVMLRSSWLTWPDVLIDFGRELYVPWRLSEGEVLYRDIVSYFNGPLSPYLHAALFKMFGVSLRTLVCLNLLVVTALAALLYALCARAAGRVAATAAGVTFFVLFAFAQYLFGGNFNYVCPYSYELPHGITLTAAAIWCVHRWNVSGRRGWLIACGSFAGLVFLTKAEVFFAALVSLAVGLAAVPWAKRKPPRGAAADAATCVLAAVAPVVVALVLLMIRLPPSEAIRGVAGAWRWVGDRTLLDLPYFKALAGTADVGASLLTILIWTGGYALLFGIPGGVALLLRRPNRARPTLAVMLFAGIVVAGLARDNWQRLNWNNFIRPTPLLLLFAAVALVAALVRRPAADRPRLVLPLMLASWALAMLAKMPLNAHIYHYGFALAMPATIVGVVMLVGWLPALIDRAGGYGNLLRATVAGALVVACYAHGRAMDRFWSQKTVLVGQGDDAFWTDPRGLFVNRMIDEVNRVARPGETLVVVPEGLSLNYFTRRVNPTGQLNFTPPAIIMYGEDEMLRAFRARPPDYIILTSVDTAEYGPRFFGFDYARELGSWMQANYETVSLVGDPPFKTENFGMVLLRRSGKLER